MNAFAALSKVDRSNLPGFECAILADLAFDKTKGVCVYVWSAYPGWHIWGTTYHLLTYPTTYNG